MSTMVDRRKIKGVNLWRMCCGYVEVDVSSPTYPHSYMKMDLPDWRKIKAAGFGKVTVCVPQKIKYAVARQRWTDSPARLHRSILGTDCESVDHLNGDGLDNRRSNLVETTQRRNCMNRHNARTSLHPGVSWITREGQWSASIKINGKSKFLGLFRDEKQAAAIYLREVKRLEDTQ